MLQGQMWPWRVWVVTGQVGAVLGQVNGRTQLRGAAELGFILHLDNTSDVLKILNISRDF